MIHHLARAFFVRSAHVGRPVRAKTEPHFGEERSLAPLVTPPVRRIRISTDPLDARRTVITGRFADVCAALDRLVLEQEALV